MQSRPVVTATCIQPANSSVAPTNVKCPVGYSPDAPHNTCVPLIMSPGSLVCPAGYTPDNNTNSCIPQNLSVNSISCPANYYNPQPTLTNSAGKKTGMCAPTQYNNGAPPA
jgi:hypothetical protein